MNTAKDERRTRAGRASDAQPRGAGSVQGELGATGGREQGKGRVSSGSGKAMRRMSWKGRDWRQGGLREAEMGIQVAEDEA